MNLYYRVESINNTDTKRNTINHRVGNFINFKPYYHFYGSYIEVMEKIPDIPIDFLVTVNNQIYQLGDMFMDHIRCAIDEEGNVDLYAVIPNPKYIGLEISVKYLNDFIQRFDEANPFVRIDDNSFFWEYFLEIVRGSFFPKLPSRLDSILLYTSEDSCNYILKNHLDFIGHKYKVVVNEMTAIFEGDMQLIDNIDPRISYINMIKLFHRYWSSGRSENPFIEVVFQGEYTLEKM